MAKLSKELRDSLKKLIVAKLDDKGHELLNPEPMFLEATPSPPTLKDQIQRVLKYELAKRADMKGFETFEEADDFDMPEEDPISQYEIKEMEEEYPVEPTDPAELLQPDTPEPPKTPEELIAGLNDEDLVKLGIQKIPENKETVLT